MMKFHLRVSDNETNKVIFDRDFKCFYGVACLGDGQHVAMSHVACMNSEQITTLHSLALLLHGVAENLRAKDSIAKVLVDAALDINDEAGIFVSKKPAPQGEGEKE